MNDQPEGYQVSRARGTLLAILLAVLSVPAPARAIDLLPAPMRPFYEVNRTFLVDDTGAAASGARSRWADVRRAARRRSAHGTAAQRRPGSDRVAHGLRRSLL
jgi:hypothetical protein